METNTYSRMVVRKVNSTEEGKPGHFNEVMAAIMLSRALCFLGRGIVGFLAVWGCIAMCFLKGTTLFIGLIESSEENRLSSFLTRLMLFPCLINTAIGEKTLSRRMNFWLFLLELDLVFIVYRMLEGKTLCHMNDVTDMKWSQVYFELELRALAHCYMVYGKYECSYCSFWKIKQKKTYCLYMFVLIW